MLIRVAGGRKPPPSYVLDKGRAINNNLMACLPYNRPGGGTIDLVTGGQSITSVGTYTWSQTANGDTRAGTTVSEIIPSFDLVPVASAVTIAILTTVTNNNCYLAAKGATVAGVFLGEWGIIKNSSNQFRFKYGSNGTVTGSTSMGTARHWFVAQILGTATTANLWIDKTPETPSGNITLANNTKPLVIGGISDNAGSVDSSFRATQTIEAVFWWNRYLPDAEIIDFQDNPWQGLVPAVSRRYFFGKTATGTAKPVFYHQRQQQGMAA